MKCPACGTEDVIYPCGRSPEEARRLPHFNRWLVAALVMGFATGIALALSGLIAYGHRIWGVF
ncbi:MAG TPA: hypothetical protein VF950_28640 [Planctomycetota bacterium]